MSDAIRPRSDPVPDLGNFKDVAVIELLVRQAIGRDRHAAADARDREGDDGCAQPDRWRGGRMACQEGRHGQCRRFAAAFAASAAPALPQSRPGHGAGANKPAAVPALRMVTGDTQVMRVVMPTAGLPGARADLPLIDEPGFSRAHAGPSVRRLARELGVDLARIAGTGLKGRITHDDVKASSSARCRVRRSVSVPRLRHRRRCPQCAESTSRLSARLRSNRCRASRNCPARGCMRPGSIFRMSRSSTRPILRRWRCSRPAEAEGRGAGRQADAVGLHRPRLRPVLRDFPVLNASLDNPGRIWFSKSTSISVLLPTRLTACWCR